jgi:putative nucleotidyltransferase with HDIG domain
MNPDPITAAAAAPHVAMARAHWGPVDPAGLKAYVGELPALPQAVLELLQLLRNDRLSTEQCIRLIESDPILSTRTLRLANSAFYGMAGRVTRLTDAVAMLGLRTVAGALAAAALTQTLRQEDCPGYSHADHWQHSVATALCARELAPRAGLDAEEAFLAGLMHDFGCLVLALHCPQGAAAAMALSRQQVLPLHEAEAEVLGLNHAQVGALLAQHWHFPPEIVAAIEHHHRLPSADADQRVSLQALVQLANSVAQGIHHEEAGQAGEAAGPPLDAALAQALALDEAALLELQARTLRGVQEMCAALHL